MGRSFRDIAAEYCAWVDGRQMREDVGVWLARILAEMVHVIYSIEDDGGADAGAREEDGFKRRDYFDARTRLPALPFKSYREFFDSFDFEDSDVVVADLHDDLADIYGDLREGLFIYDHDSPTEAERYWMQSFRYHWGEHATGALRALYWHLRNKA